MILPQFGSPPFQEDFTKRALTNRLRHLLRIQMGFRTYYVYSNKFRNPLTIPHDRFRQLQHQPAERFAELLAGGTVSPGGRHPGRTVRQHDHRIVRAHVTVDGDPIEAFLHRFLHRPARQSLDRFASVVMKQSIVAMLGQIIPAPFTQPPIRTR